MFKTWMGIPVDKFTREELVGLIEYLADFRRGVSGETTSDRDAFIKLVYNK